MGYRSDVALVLSPKGIEALNAVLQDANLSEDSRTSLGCLLQKADDKKEDASTGAKFWYWEWIKWYLEYPDIHLLEDVLSKLDPWEYRFIRIGEDQSDTDVIGDYDEKPFCMEVIRHIEFCNN